MNNNETHHQLTERDFEPGNSRLAITSEGQLNTFIKELGLVESAELVQIRVDAQGADNAEELNEHVLAYRDVAEKESAKLDTATSVKQLLAAYLKIALFYFEQGVVDNAQELLNGAIDYAYEMSNQFQLDFTSILNQLDRIDLILE